MPACCSTFERAAEQQFNERKAAQELKRYRTKGPGPTTRLLQEGIAQAGAPKGTLLDIGSGVGSLTFGLLERGITHAVAVDASSAYNGVARQEAERLGRAEAVQFVHGDFVTVASELPIATLVTLDRVVCCYPSYEPLLDAALCHTDRCLAFSYPRDVWYVHLEPRRFQKTTREDHRTAGTSQRTRWKPSDARYPDLTRSSRRIFLAPRPWIESPFGVRTTGWRRYLVPKRMTCRPRAANVPAKAARSGEVIPQDRPRRLQAAVRLAGPTPRRPRMINGRASRLRHESS